MFSTRTSWDFQSSPLYQVLREKRARGEGILDLTESNPTRCGFRYDTQSTLNALTMTGTAAYEPDPKGLRSAREAISAYYAEGGVSVDPEQVLLTASTSEAYMYLFRLLCNVGDALLLPKPSYPLFDDLCQLNDITPHYYQLAYDGEWHIDVPLLAQMFSPGVRGLVLVHPNNPTGSFIKVEERTQIIDCIQRRGIPLIVDEVFAPFGFGADGRRAESFGGNQSVLTFTLNGLSKIIGLPQMKLAWIVVSGPASARNEAMARLEMIGDLFLSVGGLVQRALPDLLQGLQPITREIRDRVRGNYHLISNVQPPKSHASVLQTEGGWSAILLLPSTQTDEEWALSLLRSHNVLVHPGHLFHFQQKSCVVVSLLPSEEVVREGIERIFAAVDAEDRGI